jgi:small GTP-binding protein
MSKQASGVETYKVAVCGGGGVGKSCLTIQFVQNQFIETWDPTIEDSYNKQIKVSHNAAEHNIMLNILDTAGQEEYRALRDEYMRAGDGFLMVFDLTNSKTFNELEQFRIQIQRSKDNEHPPIVVVGNKADLPDDLKKVSTKDAQALCQKWGVKYMECSAKTRTNIDESFELLVKEILNQKKPADKANPNAGAGKKKGGCLIL